MIYLVNLLKSTKGVPKMSFNHININQLTNLEANYYLGVKARACAQRMKIGKDKVYRYYKLFMQGLTVQEIYNQYLINKSRCGRKPIVLSKEKLKVFLEAASKNPWYLEILLGLFCGLRKGEILGLKFQDFDFEKQTVRISRQLVGNLKLKEKEFTVTEYAVIERNPKTENSYRILRVPKVVMQEVKRRQQLIELRKTDSGIEYKNFDYVCCQENGEPRSLTAMNQALTKICNRNGLPNITVHGLRHMFATILIELGVPLFKISGLLGHSSVHTTYEYYCEIMDEQDKIIAFVNNTFVPQRTETEG